MSTPLIIPGLTLDDVRRAAKEAQETKHRVWKKCSERGKSKAEIEDSRRKYKTIELPCFNLGPQFPSSQTCGCQEKTRKCEVHDLCTTGKRRPGIQCCVDCSDFETAPNIYDDGWKRHLLYYIYPVSTNDMWKWNLDQIRKRIDLFNGRRVIAVSVNSKRHKLVDPSYVKEYIGGMSDIQFIPHKRKLGEVTAFLGLWSRVNRFNTNKDATFYAHAKGVTSSQKYKDIPTWAELMYLAGLDHWGMVRDALTKHPITGSFRFAAFHFPWHYSGTFFWCRNDAVFSRNWNQISLMYGGSEMWPSSIFSYDESHCLFGNQPPMSLYHPQMCQQYMNEYKSTFQRND